MINRFTNMKGTENYIEPSPTISFRIVLPSVTTTGLTAPGQHCQQQLLIPTLLSLIVPFYWKVEE